MTDAELLEIVKTDLELSYDVSSDLGQSMDLLLQNIIASAKEQLKINGITLNMDSFGDVDLVRMFACYLYRKRKENIPQPPYLKKAIIERLLHEKASDV